MALARTRVLRVKHGTPTVELAVPPEDASPSDVELEWRWLREEGGYYAEKSRVRSRGPPVMTIIFPREERQRWRLEARSDASPGDWQTALDFEVTVEYRWQTLVTLANRVPRGDEEFFGGELHGAPLLFVAADQSDALGPKGIGALCAELVKLRRLLLAEKHGLRLDASSVWARLSVLAALKLLLRREELQELTEEAVTLRPDGLVIRPSDVRYSGLVRDVEYALEAEAHLRRYDWQAVRARLSEEEYHATYAEFSVGGLSRVSAPLDRSGLYLSLDRASRCTRARELHLIDSNLTGIAAAAARVAATHDASLAHLAAAWSAQGVQAVTTRSGLVAVTSIDIDESQLPTDAAVELQAERRYAAGAGAVHWYLVPASAGVDSPTSYEGLEPRLSERPANGLLSADSIARRLDRAESILSASCRSVSRAPVWARPLSRPFQSNYSLSTSFSVSRLKTAVGLRPEERVTLAFVVYAFDEFPPAGESPLPWSYAPPLPPVQYARAYEDIYEASYAAGTDFDFARLPESAPGDARSSPEAREAMNTYERLNRGVRVPTAEEQEAFAPSLAASAPSRRLLHVFVLLIKPGVQVAESDGEEQRTAESDPVDAESEPAAPVLRRLRAEFGGRTDAEILSDRPRWAWILGAARNRQRALRFAREVLGSDPSGWPKTIASSTRAAVFRLRGTTDGAWLSPARGPQAERYVPLLPQHYEGRRLFRDATPALSTVLDIEWLAELARDMRDDSLAAAVDSIVMEERGARLAVRLHEAYQEAREVGIHVLRRFDRIDNWVESDPCLESGDARQLPLRLVVALLQATNARHARQHPHHYRYSSMYAFRAHLVQLYSVRLDELARIVAEMGTGANTEAMNVAQLAALCRSPPAAATPVHRGFLQRFMYIDGASRFPEGGDMWPEEVEAQEYAAEGLLVDTRPALAASAQPRSGTVTAEEIEEAAEERKRALSRRLQAVVERARLEAPPLATLADSLHSVMHIAGETEEPAAEAVERHRRYAEFRSVAVRIDRAVSVLLVDPVRGSISASTEGYAHLEEIYSSRSASAAAEASSREAMGVLNTLLGQEEAKRVAEPFVEEQERLTAMLAAAESRVRSALNRLREAMLGNPREPRVWLDEIDRLEELLRGSDAHRHTVDREGADRLLLLPLIDESDAPLHPEAFEESRDNWRNLALEIQRRADQVRAFRRTRVDPLLADARSVTEEMNVQHGRASLLEQRLVGEALTTLKARRFAWLAKRPLRDVREIGAAYSEIDSLLEAARKRAQQAVEADLGAKQSELQERLRAYEAPLLLRYYPAGPDDSRTLTVRWREFDTSDELNWLAKQQKPLTRAAVATSTEADAERRLEAALRPSLRRIEELEELVNTKSEAINNERAKQRKQRAEELKRRIGSAESLRRIALKEKETEDATIKGISEASKAEEARQRRTEKDERINALEKALKEAGAELFELDEEAKAEKVTEPAKTKTDLPVVVASPPDKTKTTSLSPPPPVTVEPSPPPPPPTPPVTVPTPTPSKEEPSTIPAATRSSDTTPIVVPLVSAEDHEEEVPEAALVPTTTPAITALSEATDRLVVAIAKPEESELTERAFALINATRIFMGTRATFLKDLDQILEGGLSGLTSAQIAALSLESGILYRLAWSRGDYIKEAIGKNGQDFPFIPAWKEAIREEAERCIRRATLSIIALQEIAAPLSEQSGSILTLYERYYAPGTGTVPVAALAALRRSLRSEYAADATAAAPVIEGFTRLHRDAYDVLIEQRLKGLGIAAHSIAKMLPDELATSYNFRGHYAGLLSEEMVKTSLATFNRVIDAPSEYERITQEWISGCVRSVLSRPADLVTKLRAAEDARLNQLFGLIAKRLSDLRQLGLSELTRPGRDGIVWSSWAPVEDTGNAEQRRHPSQRWRRLEDDSRGATFALERYLQWNGTPSAESFASESDRRMAELRKNLAGSKIESHVTAERLGTLAAHGAVLAYVQSTAAGAPPSFTEERLLRSDPAALVKLIAAELWSKSLARIAANAVRGTFYAFRFAERPVITDSYAGTFELAKQSFRLYSPRELVEDTFDRYWPVRHVYDSPESPARTTALSLALCLALEMSHNQVIHDRVDARVRVEPACAAYRAALFEVIHHAKTWYELNRSSAGAKAPKWSDAPGVKEDAKLPENLTELAKAVAGGDLPEEAGRQTADVVFKFAATGGSARIELQYGRLLKTLKEAQEEGRDKRALAARLSEFLRRNGESTTLDVSASYESPRVAWAILIGMHVLRGVYELVKKETDSPGGAAEAIKRTRELFPYALEALYGTLLRNPVVAPMLPGDTNSGSTFDCLSLEAIAHAVRLGPHGAVIRAHRNASGEPVCTGEYATQCAVHLNAGNPQAIVRLLVGTRCRLLVFVDEPHRPEPRLLESKQRTEFYSKPSTAFYRPRPLEPGRKKDADVPYLPFSSRHLRCFTRKDASSTEWTGYALYTLPNNGSSVEFSVLSAINEEVAKEGTISFVEPLLPLSAYRDSQGLPSGRTQVRFSGDLSPPALYTEKELFDYLADPSLGAYLLSEPDPFSDWLQALYLRLGSPPARIAEPTAEFRYEALLRGARERADEVDAARRRVANDAEKHADAISNSLRVEMRRHYAELTWSAEGAFNFSELAALEEAVDNYLREKLIEVVNSLVKDLSIGVEELKARAQKTIQGVRKYIEEDLTVLVKAIGVHFTQTFEARRVAYDHARGAYDLAAWPQ